MTSSTRHDALVLFHSIHFVLTAERILKERGIEIDLVPVPKNLSADCGMAIAFYRRDLESVRELLQTERCKANAIYLRTPDGYEEAGK